jgi:hypothetical protein
VGSGLFLTGVAFGSALFKICLIVFGCIIVYLMVTVH